MKKILPWLIAVSLALNLAFAIVFLRSGSGESRSTDAAVEAPRPAAAPPATSAIAGGEDWASLAPVELPSLVADLRAAGYPPNVIGAIVSAIITEQFAARRAALDPQNENRPFWKNRPPDAAYEQAQRDLWREQEKALRDALGEDPYSDDPMTLARDKQRFGNLAPEKLREVRGIVREFDEKRSALYVGGVYTETERAKAADLDRQQRSAIAQILSPAELEEYDMRSSNTGRSLRTELAAFDPTEAEFRAIFALRRPFDEQWTSYGSDGIPSQEDMARRSEADKALRAQIAAAIGPARAADYELMTNANYRRTGQLVARLGLPAQTTRQLAETQMEYQQRSLEIRRTAANAQDRNTQLTALQQEATTKVAAMLGSASAAEAYKQYGGSWLNSMVPRPPPAPKK
jgi:hypothetical protein